MQRVQRCCWRIKRQLPGAVRRIPFAIRLHRIDPERVKADMTAAGFVFESASNLLRRSEDDHSKLVFDLAVRGKTDRFILKFRRP